MSVNGEIHNACNLYIKKNTITIAPRGNFTKNDGKNGQISQRPPQTSTTEWDNS